MKQRSTRLTPGTIVGAPVRQLFGFALAGALIGALVSGCEGKTRRTPDDTLVVLVPTTIRDLDPRYVLGSTDGKLSKLVAPGLTSIDQPSLEPALELAASLEPVTHNDEGEPIVWEAVVRKDARFGDGSPVSAHDVAYTYQSMMTPDSDSVYRQGFIDRFERVEAIDDRRVRFYLNKPLANFMTDMDFGIVSRAAANAGGGKFVGGRVVGAGPFRVAAFHGERVRLERNPHYHGGAAPIPKVDVRVIRDANARLLMLVGGSADFAQNTLRYDLIGEVEERERLTVVTGPSAILSYLMFNTEDPALADVRVRRAIALAIDRERIVEAKFGGRAVLASGLLPPSHWAYDADVTRYPYAPERARALLDEAGFPDPDGDGPRPRLSLTYKTSSDQFRVALARVIAAQLAEVGIDVEVRSYEFGTFLSDIKRGNFQLGSMQTSPISEPDYYFAFYHSSRIPSEDNWNLLNRWRYRNDRIDHLTAEGRRVSDRARRRLIYAEVQQILADDLPVVPLWHEDNVAVLNADVAGYRLLPAARFRGLEAAAKRTE